MELGYFDSLLREEDSIPSSEEGLERIGAGNNRIVFRVVDDSYVEADVEGMVFKRAYPHADENQRETEIWMSVKGTEYEQYFVPVVASAPDSFWILMPYVSKATSVPEDTLKLLQDEFSGQDISTSDFGVYEDSVRCYDYGTCVVPPSVR